MSEEHVRIVHRAYEALRRRDVDAFLADMAAFGPARAVYERNTRIAADRVRDLLREGRVSGNFRDLDDAFVGEVVAQVMHGIVTGDLTRRTGLTDAQAYERLARLVLAAVTSGGR